MNRLCFFVFIYSYRLYLPGSFFINNFFNATFCVSGDCPLSVSFCLLAVPSFPFFLPFASLPPSPFSEKTTRPDENHRFSTSGQ